MLIISSPGRAARPKTARKRRRQIFFEMSKKSTIFSWFFKVFRKIAVPTPYSFKIQNLPPIDSKILYLPPIDSPIQNLPPIVSTLTLPPIVSITDKFFQNTTLSMIPADSWKSSKHEVLRLNSRDEHNFLMFYNGKK